jgi:hypothetical protein
LSQSAKSREPQEFKRRNWAGPAGADALNHADAAIKRAGFPDVSLVTRWREIAGDGVASVAEPVRFQEGAGGAVLTLRCTPGSAVFLQHETRALIARLNGFLGTGRIARLRFVPGTVSATDDVPKHPMRGRKLPAADAKTLGSALERMTDLRRILKK